jgi:hypothetical protein
MGKRDLARAASTVSTEQAGEPRSRKQPAEGKSWAKVLPAECRNENGKAPFPGLFQ